MRDIKSQRDAFRDTARSAAAEGSQSNVFPIHPGWPPAELPSHGCELRQVGESHPIVRDWEDEN